MSFRASGPPWTPGQTALAHALALMLVAGNLAACASELPAEREPGLQGAEAVEAVEPIELVERGKVIQLVAGGYHTCVLLDTGRVRCWGDNNHGQLGYGNTEHIGDDETPASAGDVPLGAAATQLGAGAYHTCALLGNGAVRCWGYGYYGQLGYGNRKDIGDNETPASAGNVLLGGVATQLAVGGYHTCALLDTGAVRCWGYGDAGRLGYGNSENIGNDEKPVAAGDVALGGAATQLAAGALHTCALLDTGAVRCWGYGYYGQLGYGNGENIGDDETPVSAGEVALGGTATQLAAGTYRTCALLDSGAVRCWGYGGRGELGYGNTENIGDDETPASAGEVALGGTVTQLAAGAHHTCALLDSGAVRCWGYGGRGQLGYGNTENIGDDETPASAGEVALGGAAIQLAAGAYHTCALLATRAVRCWGYNRFGQLGYGNTKRIGDDETPASVGRVPILVDLDEVIQLAAAESHTCALLGSGEVRCWGGNDGGQLGYGNLETIGDDEWAGSAGEVPLGGGIVIQLATGRVHTCALMETGAVRCWGGNVQGQLGYGIYEPIGDDEPAELAGEVPLGAAAVHLGAGAFHMCALLNTGGVRCWGYGGDGQLGYGNTNTIGDDEPAGAAGDVALGGAVIQLAAGTRHTCALLAGGAVRCWGDNRYGQLGYGNTETIGDDETPASAGDVPLGGAAVWLAAGGYFTCALMDTGAVRCWGYNYFGQLGYGITMNIGDDETPAEAGDVPLGSVPTRLAAGVAHTCALMNNGAVRCWGYNYFGQLGYSNRQNIGDNEPAAAAGNVPLGGGAIQLAAGTRHTCALLAGGAARCWGDNRYGQLGYGNTMNIGDDESPESAGGVPIVMHFP